jgi:rubredoxin
MTTPEPSRDCPQCGTKQGQGDDYNRAFVTYQPNPNDAQDDCDWSGELPHLEALVCTNCGYVLGVFDPRNLDEDDEQDETSDFRIEEELT